jgi:N6-L-threonylcarbamoyladenine synthase
LAGSLLVGLSAAKALAVALDIPLVAVNHLQAHIYACRIADGPDVFPCVGLVVSGGHTSLYHCRSPLDFTPLGGTIDDAAGEAFDKVAAMLGLSYPGGPSIERAAASGNAGAYDFPRSFLREERLDFSFSGLKTAVRYQIAGQGMPVDPSSLAPQTVADLAASFQQAVIDCLVGKSLQALEKTRLTTLCVAGGVAANRAFRDQLERACQKRKIALHVPPPKLCTDNAVMGALAVERLKAGLIESLELDAYPGLVRGH